MSTWSKDELRKIAETDDLHISPFREDGKTYGTPTWIWSVVVDDVLYVRAYNGQNSRWCQAAVQLIDRKPLSGVTVTKFNESLREYFGKEEAGEKGLPSVNYMASQLNLSPKYLSDLLKQETGKTALELIHLCLISEAKNMLTAGDLSISEFAFKLGFENPPYFSRLFKKEVGLSPTEF